MIFHAKPKAFERAMRWRSLRLGFGKRAETLNVTPRGYCLSPRAVWVIPLISVVFLCGASGAGRQGEPWWPAKGSVSLISLIANPERYDGKRIRTTGVAVIAFEELMLYVTPYDAQYHVFNNGVWLDLDHKQIAAWRDLSHKMVEVEGTVHIPVQGSYGSCPNGAITNITSFKAYDLRPKQR